MFSYSFANVIPKVSKIIELAPFKIRKHVVSDEQSRLLLMGMTVFL